MKTYPASVKDVDLQINSNEISTADNDVRYVPTETTSFCGIAHESRYQWVVKKWDLTENVVLDFGCGSGYGAHILAKKAKAVVGIDYSSTAIEYAKQRYSASNIKFKTIDACSEETVSILGKNGFDMVISFDVIEHIERYFNYLGNILKLIKPKGTLIIGCPNRLQTFAWNKRWNHYHFQEFSPYQFRKILSLHFNIVQLYSQDFRDTLKREEIRLSLIRHNPKQILQELQLNKLQKWLLKKMLSALMVSKKTPSKLYNRLCNKQANNIMCEIDDIEFQLEPKKEILENAFGLIAVCSQPIQYIPSHIV